MASCTLATEDPLQARDSVVHDLLSAPGRNTSLNREDGDEPRPGRARAVQGQAAAVPDDDVTGDGQTQARAAAVGGAGVVEPCEPLEDRLPRLRWDAGPVVGDGEDHRTVVLVQGDSDPLPGMPDGVVEQVGHGALQRRLVPAD